MDVLPNEISYLKKMVEGMTARLDRAEKAVVEMAEMVEGVQKENRDLKRKIGEMAEKKAPARKRKTPPTTTPATAKTVKVSKEEA